MDTTLKRYLNYFNAAIHEAKSFIYSYVEKHPEIVIKEEFLEFGLTEKNAEKIVAKFPIPAPELKEFFMITENFLLVWSLKDYEGKFEPIARIQIPKPKEILQNINPFENAYFELNFDTGKSQVKYLSDLNLKGKALKEFKDNLPKLYYFDLFDEPDEYTVLWFYQDKYGLALITSQGEDLEILPWSLPEYLYFMMLALGLRDWQKAFLKDCPDKNINCLITKALESFEYRPEYEKILQHFYEELHKVIGDLPSVLLKYYVYYARRNEDNFDNVKQLLEKEKANPNILFADGQTPLMKASRVNDLKIVNLLLEFGADVNIKDKEGRTALQLFLDRSKIDVPTVINFAKNGQKFDNQLVEIIIEKKIITKKKYTDNPEMKILVEKMIEAATGETKEKLKTVVEKLKDNDLMSKF